MPYLEHVIILCDTNNINKDSPFDIAEFLIEINKYFKERSCNIKVVISGIITWDKCGSVNRIIVSKINGILADKCCLDGFYFIDQKYGWTRENSILNPNLYFKDNVHFIEQGNAKLASSILATINDNITLPAFGKSIITNYKNAVSFSFKDDDFPPLASPALQNHCIVNNNVSNTASNIMKPF